MVLDRTEFKTINEIAEVTGLRIHTIWERVTRWGMDSPAKTKLPNAVRPAKLYSLPEYLAREAVACKWAKLASQPVPLRRSPHLDMTFSKAVVYLRNERQQKISTIARLLRTTPDRVIQTLYPLEVPHDVPTGPDDVRSPSTPMASTP